MEEMKHRFQSILGNLKERGQPRQEVVSKLEKQFSNELEEQHSKNLQEVGEFQRSPM